MMEYRIEPRAAKLGNRRHRSSAVELSIRNRVVVGSIPTGGSEKSCYGGGWRLVKVGGGGCSVVAPPYEKLHAWRECHELALAAYRVTKTFPQESQGIPPLSRYLAVVAQRVGLRVAICP